MSYCLYSYFQPHGLLFCTFFFVFLYLLFFSNFWFKLTRIWATFSEYCGVCSSGSGFQGNLAKSIKFFAKISNTILMVAADAGESPLGIDYLGVRDSFAAEGG